MADASDTPNGAIVQCRLCGGGFPKRQGKNEYCRPCAVESKPHRIREAKERWRRAAGKAKIGRSMRCASCAATIVRLQPSQKYCATCSEEKKRRTVREWARKNSEFWRKYREANRDLLNAYARAWSKTEKCRSGRSKRGADRRANDPKFGLHERMSRMVRQALKEKKAGRRWEDLVGYSVDDLRRHLEKQFLTRMSWSNFGRWHIDHIVPVAAFSFTGPDDQEFAACWALTNLRPLWKEKNLSKGAKRTHLL